MLKTAIKPEMGSSCNSESEKASIRGFVPTKRMMKSPTLYLCDFGYGVRRYDIGKIGIYEDIDNEGNYRGVGWSVQFDFASETIEFMFKLHKFLGGPRYPKR